MARARRGKDLKRWKTNRADAGPGKLRIIGGDWRGRLIEYSGDPVTRPMKDNVREALFNLVGGWVPGKVVFDLFAGTGAVGLESVSRGARHAVLVERHFPTVRIIERNVAELTADGPRSIEVHASDTFFWVRQFARQPRFLDQPWMVFCCPPYELYLSQERELQEMLNTLMALAPPESLFVVESDQRFDAARLPQAAWEVRQYAPAQVAVLKMSPDHCSGSPDDDPSSRSVEADDPGPA